MRTVTRLNVSGLGRDGVEDDDEEQQPLADEAGGGIRRRLARTTYQVRTLNSACFFFFFKLIGVVVVVMFLVSLLISSMSEKVSVQLTIPTRTEFAQWIALSNVSGSDAFCSLPIRMTPFPRPNARFVLVSPLGSGGARFAHFVRDVTRVAVSAPSCMLGVQLVSITKDALLGECTGFFFYAHHVLVRFQHASEIPLYFGVEKTRPVYVVRHPFRAAWSAYRHLASV